MSTLEGTTMLSRCRHMVHVETHLNVYEKNDSTNQCAKYKLKIVYKT